MLGVKVPPQQGQDTDLPLNICQTMGVMDALSCEIFVKCQPLDADVTLNYCEQKIISL